MNAIRSVFAALANLAASINNLAGVLDSAGSRLRQQLAIDSEPALTHNGRVADGEIIDGETVGSSSTAKRGRKAN